MEDYGLSGRQLGPRIAKTSNLPRNNGWVARA